MKAMDSVKKISIFFIVISSFSAGYKVCAQAIFIAKGKIEYEKKVNMHKWMGDDFWSTEMKDRMPVYRTTYFDLLFDSSTSAYRAGREVADDKWKNWWSEGGSEDNVVHMDFGIGVYTAIKQVFEKKFMIQDTLLPIDWRITDEVRTIAGFDCRKAVGKMFDSLYVVAFYTDQIPLPTGPEQYNGLPGVILGLALPRFYTTWFATKVELVTPPAKDIKLPSGKTSKLNRKELMTQVEKVFQWGTEEEKQKNFWSIIL